MRLLACAFVVLLSWSPAVAAPPSCAQVLAALSSGADAAAVATDLGTTRARVNACAKIGEAEERQAERRAELHRQREQRGLD
ncbi:MAG TPA: hypothetical protein ENO14_02880 [Chromatiales bacterium]|nr:hypothetical protein [Chromatiales bacterium]